MKKLKLDPRDWQKFDEVMSASTRGFNPLTTLPKMLKELIPEFDIGFFSEEDIPMRQADRWVVLRPEHLEGTEEEINQVLPLRFGVQIRDGAVRYRNYVLMVMPTDYRKRMHTEMNKRGRDLFQQSISASPTSDMSPAFDQHIARVPREEPVEAPKKRGRPRKE